jgi:hypothetical protein
MSIPSPKTELFRALIRERVQNEDNPKRSDSSPSTKSLSDFNSSYGAIVFPFHHLRPSSFTSLTPFKVHVMSLSIPRLEKSISKESLSLLNPNPNPTPSSTSSPPLASPSPPTSSHPGKPKVLVMGCLAGKSISQIVDANAHPLVTSPVQEKITLHFRFGVIDRNIPYSENVTLAHIRLFCCCLGQPTSHTERLPFRPLMGSHID